MITQVKYSNETGDQVQITMDDGRVMIAPLEGGTWVHAELSEWRAIPENVILPYKTEAELLEEKSNFVRSQRDQLLAQCDWTMLPDVALSADDQALWMTYRQALRDIPEQTGFPFEVTWPTKP